LILKGGAPGGTTPPERRSIQAGLLAFGSLYYRRLPE
jgi:hypothetical protein